MPVSFFQHCMQVGSFKKCHVTRKKKLCLSSSESKNYKSVKHLVLYAVFVQYLLATLCSVGSHSVHWEEGQTSPVSNSDNIRNYINWAGGPSSPPNISSDNRRNSIHWAGGPSTPPNSSSKKQNKLHPLGRRPTYSTQQ